MIRLCSINYLYFCLAIMYTIFFVRDSRYTLPLSIVRDSSCPMITIAVIKLAYIESKGITWDASQLPVFLSFYHHTWHYAQEDTWYFSIQQGEEHASLKFWKCCAHKSGHFYMISIFPLGIPIGNIKLNILIVVIRYKVTKFVHSLAIEGL